MESHSKLKLRRVEKKEKHQSKNNEEKLVTNMVDN